MRVPVCSSSWSCRNCVYTCACPYTGVHMCAHHGACASRFPNVWMCTWACFSEGQTRLRVSVCAPPMCVQEIPFGAGMWTKP